jgi:hypothetical protein
MFVSLFESGAMTTCKAAALINVIALRNQFK